METVRPATTLELEPRRPAPARRFDLYAALAVTLLASVAYGGALFFDILPARGLSVVFFAAAPISAGFALVVLVPRARREKDRPLLWFCAGLGVAWLAMLLQLISFPAVDPNGSFLGTNDQSSAALYLLFHLALALGAAAGAFAVPRFRLAGVVAGLLLAVLVSVNAFPLPVLLRPDGSYTPLLEVFEVAVALVVAASTLLWIRRVGREATALRGWAGVALSLSVYDLLLNALGHERFTPVWWASLSMRVATYAVLAVGALVTVLVRLRDVETYSEAELERREGQLRSSLRLSAQLLSCAEDLARAVTPSEVADALCVDAVETSGLGHASLLVTRADQGLSLLGSAGYDSRMRAEVGRIGWDAAHPGPRSLMSGEAVFLDSAEEILSRFPAVSRTPMRAAEKAAALPIRVRNEPVAALVVWDKRPSAWTPLQREILAGLAAQGGQALHRALAYEEEATAAATLQRSLLPLSLPVREGITMASRYVSGERGLRVGGDWYDCVVIDADRVALVVGDVMGKGLRAAALMGQIRTSLRSLAIVDPSPVAVLNGLDRLTQDLDTYEIATVAYVLLDVREGVARFGRAGHLPPLLVDPQGRARMLEEGGSPPLGSPVAQRVEAEVRVEPGSLLVLYTDGIVEDRATGLDGLPGFVTTVEEVAAAHPDDTEKLATELLTRTESPGRNDDIALLLTRYTGGDVTTT